MTKNEVLDSTLGLVQSIDGSISALIAARLSKDGDAENDAVFQMETLLVDSQQQLSFLIDYIKKNVKE